MLVSVGPYRFVNSACGQLVTACSTTFAVSRSPPANTCRRLRHCRAGATAAPPLPLRPPLHPPLPPFRRQPLPPPKPPPQAAALPSPPQSTDHSQHRRHQ